MLNHRIQLSIANQKIILLKNFHSLNSSNKNLISSINLSTNLSLNLNLSTSNEITDQPYPFNSQLIERIKKTQLFNCEFINIKKNDKYQQINLSEDIQKYLPSVSKIISQTMTEENIKVLELWKAKMIKKLGEIGFKNYQNEIFSRGKRLHKNIEYKLKKQYDDIKIDDDISGFWTSIQPILNEITDVHLIEKQLNHSNLLYKGIVDCVAKLNQTNTIIDWKSSDKIKDTKSKLYDAPIQTVAYLGALNQSNLLDFEIDRVAVVVAYKDGQIANYHNLNEKDCKEFWNLWTKKVEQYWIDKFSNSPADPKLLNYFDDLIALSIERNKKIYTFNQSKFVNLNELSKDSSKVNSIKSGLTKKEQLIELLKKNVSNEER